MKLVSTAEMVAIEQQADLAGLSYARMMENAGRGVAEIVHQLRFDAGERVVLGLVGPGNNGGDTLVALSHLSSKGWRVRAYLISRKADLLAERLAQLGGELVFAQQDADLSRLTGLLQTSGVVLDGVLGMGSRPPLRGDVSRVLERAQLLLGRTQEAPYVVAVDCPSGVDCDTGEVAPQSITADLTAVIAAVKRGLVRMPAFGLVGELHVVDIGISRSSPALQAVRFEVAEADSVAGLLPARPIDSHKGTFGAALIVAGSVSYTGAAWLAGKAAYRVGAGLVTLAVPRPLHAALSGHLPEATWILLPDTDGAISREAVELAATNSKFANAVLIGPGMGTAETTRDFIKGLLMAGATKGKPSGAAAKRRHGAVGMPATANTIPAPVIDADGLKLLSKIKDWHKLLPSHAVLTPHPGEMALLTAVSKDEIQLHRESITQSFAKEWGHVVVLKGALTVVADPDGRMTIIPVASAALARAGTGDVLAGLIVGLRAQGVKAFEAAVAGAWIHAHAGRQAASELGSSASVLAGDVLASVPHVMRDLTIRARSAISGR